MAQYDPIVIKSGIPSILGADTLRADRLAAAGLTISGPVSGDACQISETLTVVKAVNTSTNLIAGIYDGEAASIVRTGVVVANFKTGVTLANGDAVYLSATAGQLTNVKPTKDMLHEVGVVVDATNKRVLLQQKPVIALPPSPPLSIWIAAGSKLYEVPVAGGSPLGSVEHGESVVSALWDGDYVWTSSQTNPGHVRKINPVTRTIVGGPYNLGDTTGVGEVNNLITFDGSTYWILDRTNKRAVRFDSNGNNVGQSGALNDGTWFLPTGLVYGNGRIYTVLDNGSELVKWFDVATPETVSLYWMGSGVVARGIGIACYYNGYLYIRTCRNMGMYYEDYITRFRCSDGDRTQFTLGTNWANGAGICTDGTYLYTNGSALSTLLKLRISDYGQEWSVAAQTSGSLAYDGTYIWSPDGTWMSQGRYVRVRASDGAVDMWNTFPDYYTHQGNCNTKTVLPRG